MRETQDNHTSPPSVHALVRQTDGSVAEQTFTSSFRIGRDPANDICLTEVSVSRIHAEVIFLAGTWWLNDLDSANGTFVDGQRVHRVPISAPTIFQFGVNGPTITLTNVQASDAKPESRPSRSLEEVEQHYFGDTISEEDAGEHTIMVRRAYARVQKHQKRKYGVVIVFISCLFLLAGSIAVYNHIQLQKQKALAAEIFFSIKTLELDFADYLREAREKKDSSAIAQVEKYRREKSKLEENYAKFIDTIGVYNKKMPPEDRLILKVARVFGECELLMPPDFLHEVHRYIAKWQSTDRFRNAITKAMKNGYPQTITTALRLYDLPAQFFYLPLQESNFDLYAVGPKTKYGIAKGMWQLIPSTARDFGLKTGPLVKVRRSDPQDDRQNFNKSTLAAAQYLRLIYDTDAQASGLLVIASYNWGQNRVSRMIRNMPHNPKDRNFWTFLTTYKGKIPKETYDYVFYIFSAAVIGENPHLFGFDIHNPLLVTSAQERGH